MQDADLLPGPLNCPLWHNLTVMKIKPFGEATQESEERDEIALQEEQAERQELFCAT